TAEIARRGFGATVSYWSRTRRRDLEDSLGIGWLELPSLLADAEVLAVHLPLSKETERLFDGPLLEQIRGGAVLLSLSPMPLFDLAALESRLARGDLTFIFDHGDELAPGALAAL